MASGRLKKRLVVSITGPGTLGDYTFTGQTYVQQLLAAGLTPYSAVLDVGCGTGALAEQLDTYLSSRGMYVGTEIAPEAVAYCRTHRAARFQFFTTSPTALPTNLPPFDIIAFHSVFTHTYPQETAALLREARQLLKNNGAVLADIFICPTTNQVTGARTKIEFNEGYFRQLVAAAGFSSATMLVGGPGQQSPFVLRP